MQVLYQLSYTPALRKFNDISWPKQGFRHGGSLK